MTVHDSNRKAFAARLRAALPPNCTIEQAAGAIGVSRSGLNKWLAGNAEPGLSYLAAIADFTGASIEWLATGRALTPRDCDAQERVLTDQLAAAAASEEHKRVRELLAINEKMRGLLALEQHVTAQLQPRGFAEGAAPYAAIDPRLVQDVVQALEEALAETNRSLSPQKKARAVALICEYSSKTGSIDRRYIDNLITIAA